MNNTTIPNKPEGKSEEFWNARRNSYYPKEHERFRILLFKQTESSL